MSQFVLSANEYAERLGQKLESFNFTVVPNIVLGTEVLAIEEVVVVEDELVVSDIISN